MALPLERGGGQNLNQLFWSHDHDIYDIVHVNYDHKLPLTYSTTVSNLAKFVFVLILGPDIR